MNSLLSINSSVFFTNVKKRKEKHIYLQADGGWEMFLETFFTHIFQACVGGLPSKPMWRDHNSFGLFSTLTLTASMMASHKGIPLTWQTRLFSFNENLLESKHLCVSVKQREDSPFVCASPLPWFCRSQPHWCLFFPHKKKKNFEEKKEESTTVYGSSVLFFVFLLLNFFFYPREEKLLEKELIRNKQPFLCVSYSFSLNFFLRFQLWCLGLEKKKLKKEFEKRMV